MATFASNAIFIKFSDLVILIKRRYCVIVYVGHFWTPGFCTISIRSLIYVTMFSLPLPLWHKHTWVGIRRLSPVSFQGEIVSDAQTRGGSGVVQAAKTCMQVCAQNYSGVWFVALEQGPIPYISPVPGPTGEWVGELCGSCRNKTLWQRLWSIHWPIHVRVKGFPRILSP